MIDEIYHWCYNSEKYYEEGCEFMAHFSDAIYQLIAMLMSLLMALGAVGTPSTDDTLKNIDPNVVLDFVVTGDTQVSNIMPEREKNLNSFSQDIRNSQIELDAFIVAGDVTENGFPEEYARIYDNINDFNVRNYILCTGNHDIRLNEYEQGTARFFDLMNTLNGGQNDQNSTYYKYMVDGYTFLVLGSDEWRFEDAFISSAQLQWLNVELKEATKTGRPVFVIAHYPLAESHGLPGTWGSANSDDVYGTLPTYVAKENPDLTGSIGEQTNKVYEVINDYKNVFFITGHLHTGFGKNTYQTIDEANNVQGINVPSVGIDNKDGSYNNPGTGLFVEVTPDEVIFYARDFAQGKFLTADQFEQAVKVYPLI